MNERYLIESKRLALAMMFLAVTGIVMPGFLCSVTFVLGMRLIQASDVPYYQCLLLVGVIITLPVCLMGIGCFWICLRQAIQAVRLSGTALEISRARISVVWQNTRLIEIPWSAVKSFGRSFGGGWVLRYLEDNKKKSLYLARYIFSKDTFEHIARTIEHDFKRENETTRRDC